MVLMLLGLFFASGYYKSTNTFATARAGYFRLSIFIIISGLFWKSLMD